MRNKRASVIIIAFVLLAAILTLSVVCQLLLDNGAGRLTGYIGGARGAVESGDWQSASDYAAQAENYWKKTSGTWAMIIDHFEVDNIESAMVKSLGYIEARDRDLALGELSQLKMYIEHIPENEKPSLRNIF